MRSSAVLTRPAPSFAGAPSEPVWRGSPAGLDLNQFSEARTIPCFITEHGVTQLVRLSYSEQALVSGGVQPVLVSVLQHPRQVPSGSHVEPLRDPRQWHRRSRTQLPSQLDFPRLALPPRFHVSLAPSQPSRCSACTAPPQSDAAPAAYPPAQATPACRNSHPAQTPAPFHPLILTPQIIPPSPLHSVLKHPLPRHDVSVCSALPAIGPTAASADALSPLSDTAGNCSRQKPTAAPPPGASSLGFSGSKS